MKFNYREELKNSYREKKSRNQGYSLRAFSRDLGVSPTALSDVMAGKRNFSEKNAKKVSEKLCFSPQECVLMLAEIKNKTVDAKKEVVQVKEDEFNLIANWYYLAILTLSQQKNVNASLKNISEIIGITKSQAKKAIDTLKSLKFIEIK